MRENDQFMLAVRANCVIYIAKILLSQEQIWNDSTQETICVKQLEIPTTFSHTQHDWRKGYRCVQFTIPPFIKAGWRRNWAADGRRPTHLGFLNHFLKVSTMDSHLEIFLKFPLICLRWSRCHILFSKKGKGEVTQDKLVMVHWWRKVSQGDSVCGSMVQKREREREWEWERGRGKILAHIERTEDSLWGGNWLFLSILWYWTHNLVLPYHPFPWMQLATSLRGKGEEVEIRVQMAMSMDRLTTRDCYIETSLLYCLRDRS